MSLQTAAKVEVLLDDHAQAGTYFVFREDGPGPKQKHLSRFSACKEADRLALANPGATFHVAKVRKTVRVNAVTFLVGDFVTVCDSHHAYGGMKGVVTSMDWHRDSNAINVRLDGYSDTRRFLPLSLILDAKKDSFEPDERGFAPRGDILDRMQSKNEQPHPLEAKFPVGTAVAISISTDMSVGIALEATIVSYDRTDPEHVVVNAGGHLARLNCHVSRVVPLDSPRLLML